MKDSQDLNRLSRLTSILTFLQTKSMVTSTELSEKFDVSKRTIYRDVKSLIDSGVPIYTEEGKGYKLMEGYNLPPVMFTEEEAAALITAEKIIARNKDKSLIEAHSKALDKIKAVLRYNQKDRSQLLSNRIASVTNFRNHTTSDSLLNIQSAITKSRCIQLHYNSLIKNEVTVRVIEPLAIYHTKENWVVIAWCRLREEFREFRLDRINKIIFLDSSFDQRDFDLKNYFEYMKTRSWNTPDIGLSHSDSRFAIINQKANKMSKTKLDEFHVVGVYTKTCNRDQQAAKDIPELWQKFMREDTGQKVLNRLSDDIICAYLEYEGDHMEPYTCLVGYKVPDLKNIPNGMKGITVPSSDYKKYLAKGDLTGKALWEVWTEIWKADIDRTFQVDFELYGNKAYPIENGEADVFIGVK